MMTYLIEEHAFVSRIYRFLKFYRVVNSFSLYRILVELVALNPLNTSQGQSMQNM